MPFFQVLCFNVDLIKSFGKHLGTQDEQWTDEDETKRIKKDIVLQIEKDNGKFVHTHQVKTLESALKSRINFLTPPRPPPPPQKSKRKQSGKKRSNLRDQMSSESRVPHFSGAKGT